MFKERQRRNKIVQGKLWYRWASTQIYVLSLLQPSYNFNFTPSCESFSLLLRDHTH